MIKYLSGLGVQIHFFPFFGHKAATNALQVLKNDLTCHALQQNVTLNCPTVKCQGNHRIPPCCSKMLGPKTTKFTEACMTCQFANISPWFPPVSPFRSTAVASRSSISTSRALCSWNKIQQNVGSFLAFTEEISSEKNEKPFELYYLERFFQKTRAFQTINQF